ncbi:MAG: efflux RND transporter periplasmic adaptor subunit, partial [SAR86 cluster bacterium]|nr:efflux RND transporter periplasmic adaptor subunit [SAR86 cluster bacterium]
MLQVLAPVVIIIAAIGGYAGLHWAKPEPEKKDRTPRALSVFVDAVERKDVALVVLTQGEVRAGTMVDLVSQIPGRVVAVSSEFIEGGLVQAG